MKFTFFKIFALIFFSLTLTGCGKIISQGNFGVEKHFGGSFNPEPHSTGWTGFQPFDSIYEIYGKEFMIKVQDVRPKDKVNIMLKDLDLNISYKANRQGAVNFLLKTEDVTYVRDFNAYVIGSKVVEKDAQAIIGHTMRKFLSEEILDQPSEVESTFKADLQKEIDTLYGKNTFEIVEVKIANVQVAESVENKIQAIAAVKAETEKNAAIQKVLVAREETLAKEARVLSNAASKGGITVDQLLQYETIKAIKEMDSSAVKLNFDAKPPKK